MYDIKKEIQIDPFALDEECLLQGRKVLDVAEAYSEAVEKRDRAKLRLDVTTANLTMQVKQDYKEFGFESKPSDIMALNTVMIQKQYIKARQRLISLNRDCELLKPGVEAFKDRSIQIGRLINLVMAGYAAGKVALTEGASEAVDRVRTEKHTATLNQNTRLQRLKREE
jgi:hypothetical protein